jgi:hypothetical protein
LVLTGKESEVRTFDIDAGKTTHPDFRPMSNYGAIAAFLDQIEEGETVCVRSITDAFGKPVSAMNFRASVSYLRGIRCFSIKSGKDGSILVRWV